MEQPHGLKLVTLMPGCGYGDAAMEYLAGLDSLGIPVSWVPVDFSKADRPAAGWNRDNANPAILEAAERLWLRPIDCDVLLLDFPPPNWQEQWLRAEPGAHAFAYAAWEVDRLPDDWAPVLNRFERVFVPSEFNRRVFVDEGVEVPVDVVPHVARAVSPVAGGIRGTSFDDDVFVFYTVGPWETRKALEEAVRAYLDTFEANEKVALVIKTGALNHIEFASMTKKAHQQGRRNLATTWWTLARIISEYPNSASVHLIADELPAHEVDALHSRADCFVSLSRCEGWGLVSFDALLFGNPAIVTGWGGARDYLGEDYPFLIDYELEATANSPYDGCFHRSETARWARADRNHAGALMRHVFGNRDSARAVAADLQRRLRARFAPAVVCRRLAESMGFELAGRGGDAGRR